MLALSGRQKNTNKTLTLHWRFEKEQLWYREPLFKMQEKYGQRKFVFVAEVRGKNILQEEKFSFFSLSPPSCGRILFRSVDFS